MTTQKTIRKSCLIFWQFLRRDYHQYRKQLRMFFISYGLIRPLLFSFSFSYLQANIIFRTQQPTLTTIFLVGNVLLVILVLSFVLAVSLLFDFEQNRFIDYQLSILHPKLIIIERILFSSLFTFFFMLPFFPVAKLLLRDGIATSNASWPQTFLMIYAGSLCYAAYHLFAICLMKNTNSIGSFWVRVNLPLMILGGFWTPLYIIRQSSALLGYVAYLNPTIYLTEGLRRALLGDSAFLPVGVCVSALFGFSVIFTLLSFHFFKKKTDHI